MAVEHTSIIPQERTDVARIDVSMGRSGPARRIDGDQLVGIEPYRPDAADVAHVLADLVRVAHSHPGQLEVGMVEHLGDDHLADEAARTSGCENCSRVAKSPRAGCPYRSKPGPVEAEPTGPLGGSRASWMQRRRPGPPPGFRPSDIHQVGVTGEVVVAPAGGL